MILSPQITSLTPVPGEDLANVQRREGGPYPPTLVVIISLGVSLHMHVDEMLLIFLTSLNSFWF
jgi:hypothetical protein